MLGSGACKRSLVGKPVLSPHYGGYTTSSVVNDWPRAAIIVVVVVIVVVVAAVVVVVVVVVIVLL